MIKDVPSGQKSEIGWFFLWKKAKMIKDVPSGQKIEICLFFLWKKSQNDQGRVIGLKNWN